jgi:membrane associated rhomboid family serine protease
MVVPLSDAPNPRGVPAATYLLIAVNVAAYVLITLPLGAQRPAPGDPLLAEYLRVMSEALRGRVEIQQLLHDVTAYDLFVFVHGFRPGAASLVDLFTSMFLHGGLLHLVGNMLFLWIYGDNVEHRLGTIRFLGWYLATGVAATLFHAAGDLDSLVPMIGASGAISGVLGFYFLLFPRNQVRLLWLFPPFFMNVFEVPARLVLGVYLVLDNLLPYLLVRGSVGVAHGAHIGGFVAGLAAAWAIGRREVVGRPQEYAAAKAPRTSLGDAIAAGRLADAARAYFALPAGQTRGLLSPGEAFALADWLRANGHPQAALTVLRRLLRDHPQGSHLADVHVRAGNVLLEDLDQPTPAYQHFLAALDLDPEPALAAAARQGLAAIAARQKRQVGHPHVRRAG